MAILDTLTLTNAARHMDAGPTVHARRKLLDALAIQIEAAAAAAKGEVFIRRVGRWIDVGGVKERRDVPVRFRPWWWKDQAGSVYLQIYYGNKPLELKTGKTAINIGSMESLLSVLEQVKQAVAAGELDKAMADAVARRQQVLKKPSAAKSNKSAT